MDAYPHHQIERKWQQRWKESRAFRARMGGPRKKYFVFCACPYVTGSLHMGHVRSYTLGDVCARYHRMQGFNVLFTLGFDSMGLPVEVAARDRNLHPRDWVREGVATMKDQMVRLGLSLDTERSFSTSEPEIFRRHQVMFLTLLEHGFVYNKTAVANWCVTCQTSIANIQVEADGTCWRCRAKVEGRRLEQWFYRMSHFSEQFCTRLDDLDWAESSKRLLRNWSGRKSGTVVRFKVEHLDETIECFTTTAEFLPTVSFLAISPEHSLVQRLLSGQVQPRSGETRDLVARLESFLDEIARTPPFADRPDRRDLKGLFTGLHAYDPIQGARLPIYIANYVTLKVGTGAVTGNPGVSRVDRDFAELYEIPYRPAFEGGPDSDDPGADVVLANSGRFSGLGRARARALIESELERLAAGGPATSYSRVDWLVSRQRYWGAPIPIIHCSSCGAVPVPLRDLPVALPEDVDLTRGTNPLPACESFMATACPRCGSPARRDPDTLDCIVDAFWQYCGPTSPRDEGPLFDQREFEYWMPVDMAFYGTDILRFTPNYQFFLYALHEIGMFPTPEPFLHTVHHEMVLKDGKKMSKSLGNTVDPEELLRNYGSDVLRLYIVSAVRAQKTFNWSDERIGDARRTIKLLWDLAQECRGLREGNPDTNVPALHELPERWRRRLRVAVTKVHGSMEKEDYFYAAQSAMQLLKAVDTERSRSTTPASRVACAKLQLFACPLLLRMLYPVIPHVCEELAEQLALDPPVGSGGLPTWESLSGAVQAAP